MEPRERLTLKVQRRKIEEVENKIRQLESEHSSYTFDIERLAEKYKELGDKYINLYRDTYAVHETIDEDLADKSFKDYEEAIRLFNKIHIDIKSIYTTMALGNAYKERFLPSMKGKESFYGLAEEARKRYDKCVEFYIQRRDKYAQEYLFAMLEQINLTVRGQVWDGNVGLLPRRIDIFHSLKSPESHIHLEGICYFAFMNSCEVWEYRYGKVRTFDDEKDFIKQRLDEASAVVVLASPDYNEENQITKEENQIIKFEIETIRIMKKEEKDPITVFTVDLGNQDLVEEFKEIGNIISKDELENIFKQHQKEIKDIYECRHFRCKG